MDAVEPTPFARAYVATLYLLGERGETLTEAAKAVGAPKLLAALTHQDKTTRARALAYEITRVALALERGRLR